MIRKDGYYISEGFPWVDWHAGHKFEGINYRILVFFNDNKLLFYTEDKLDFNIKEILANSSGNDYYKIYDNTLEIIIDPSSKWRVKMEFTIISPEILLDENLKEYRYIPRNIPV